MVSTRKGIESNNANRKVKTCLIFRTALSPVARDLVLGNIWVNYLGKRWRKEWWEGRKIEATGKSWIQGGGFPLPFFPSHHSPLSLCARSNHPPLALLTCLQLSSFSLAPCSTLSLGKAYGGGCIKNTFLAEHTKCVSLTRSASADCIFPSTVTSHLYEAPDWKN